MKGASADTFRFGPFELDVRSAELRKSGTKIRLAEQPFQILLMLLNRPGEIVSREEIRAKLWPDFTVVEFDHSINAAVKRLRNVLRESADRPRFIETLPRRGYRFVAPLLTEPEMVPQSQPESPGPAPAVTARRTRRIIPAFGIAAVVLAILGLVVVWLFTIRRAPGIQEVRVTPLTTYPGNQIQPSFSPDGTRVAFSWDGPDGRNADIYVKLIGAGDAVRMTSDPARDFGPAWSPDGRWIASLRDMGRRQIAVLLIPAAGGRPREVTRVRVDELGSGNCILAGQPISCTGSFYYRSGTDADLTAGSMLAWSPDGKFLFTSGRIDSDSPLAIIRIDVETGNQSAITAPPHGIEGDLDPAVSPDGRTLAFLRTTGYATRDLYLVSLSDTVPSRAKARRVTNDRADAGAPAWTPGGHEVVFSSDRGGRRELWRVPVTGRGNPVRLAWASEDAAEVSISPRGNRLAYARETDSSSIWRVFIDSESRTPPVRVTATTRRDIFPHPSPDGKRIAFQSDRSGVNEVWICDEDGSNAVQLTSFGKGWSGSPRWSPDGRTIAFDSNVEGNWDIWAIRSEGGRPVRLTTNPADDSMGSWSRDGKWIYFTSRRTGRLQIWKIRPDGSSETQVTTGGGWAAYESADGKYVYYKDVGEGPLWRMPVGSGTASKVVDAVRGRIFTPTERGIYFAGGPAASELRFLDFRTGSVSVVASLNTPDGGNAFISPDGHSALFFRQERADTNLMLVENFR